MESASRIMEESCCCAGANSRNQLGARVRMMRLTESPLPECSRLSNASRIGKYASPSARRSEQPPASDTAGLSGDVQGRQETPRPACFSRCRPHPTCTPESPVPPQPDSMPRAVPAIAGRDPPCAGQASSRTRSQCPMSACAELSSTCSTSHAVGRSRASFCNMDSRSRSRAAGKPGLIRSVEWVPAKEFRSPC